MEVEIMRDGFSAIHFTCLPKDSWCVEVAEDPVSQAWRGATIEWDAVKDRPDLLHELRLERYSKYIDALRLFADSGMLIVDPAKTRSLKGRGSPSFVELGVAPDQQDNSAVILAFANILKERPEDLDGGPGISRGSTNVVVDDAGNVESFAGVLSVKFNVRSCRLGVLVLSDIWLPASYTSKKHPNFKHNAYRFEKCMEQMSEIGFELACDDEFADEDVEGGVYRKRFRFYNLRALLQEVFPDTYEDYRMFCWEERSDTDASTQYGMD